MLPDWLKQEIPDIRILNEYGGLFKRLGIYSVCQEAHCPNIGSCFKNKSVTFMILGDACTRSCSFCAVKKIKDLKLPTNKEEPLEIAKAVSLLMLDYVVITSVSRDDIIDGGADIFAETIREIRKSKANVKIEVLIPDFQGKVSSLRKVLLARPDCLAHNLETVPRLYRSLRPEADYRRSLEVLKRSKEINPAIITKSGIMLGMGEVFEEILCAIRDLLDAKCDILTLGQYLSPSGFHFPVQEFVNPERFKFYQEYALQKGFKAVLSGPLVRSSYRAKELYHQLSNGMIEELTNTHQQFSSLTV